MLHIRRADPADIEGLARMDHSMQTNPIRRCEIHSALLSGECWVAAEEEMLVGFAIIEHIFFANGFVSLLYVDASQRRTGIGRALMLHLERLCRTPKLFTSTNESNLPMQRLLDQLGYESSGVIYNIDPGDPELIYVKNLVV